MAPNKKKKKPAANPARGFATVSVPKPKEEPIQDEVQEAPQSNVQTQKPQGPKTKGNGAVPKEASAAGTESMTPEQLEQHLETSEIRLAVEKHALRVKKDVARQTKALETDRRLLRLQSTPLDGVRSLNEDLVAKVMGIVKGIPSYPTITLSAPTITSGLTMEMDLAVKLWTLSETLTSLSFPSIDAVMKHVLNCTKVTSDTTTTGRETVWALEQALYWYALNVEDDDLPQYDQSSPSGPNAGEEEDSIDDASNSTPPSGHKNMSSSKSSSTIPTPAELSDDTSSEDEDDADPPSIPTYLEFRTRLFKLENSTTLDAGAPEADRSRSRAREIRKLTKKIGKAERDPLFEKRDAEYQWTMMKREMDIETAKARASSRRLAETSNNNVTDSGSDLDDTEAGAADDTGLLSGMFELGDNLPEGETEAGPEVTIREFGKWSGASPRRILEDACKTRDPSCRVNFKLVSKSFHAFRHRVEIKWSKESFEEFPGDMMLPEHIYHQDRRTMSITMHTIATPSALQSEAYTATILLFVLSTVTGQGDRANARLPTVWRHFWADLVERKAAFDADRDAQRLSELRDLVREHMPDIEARDTKTRNSKAQEQQGHVETTKRSTAPSSTAEPAMLQALWEQKASSPAYQDMLRTREQLPVYRQKSELLETFHNNQLMILCGETGSGKSTQMPSLLLESELSAGRDCKILCTQPRRISAMSLAARVSEEIGEARSDLGTMRSLVGYAIRLESKVSASTRVTYSTTGVAMRLLEKQDDLAGINVLLIDEVHERNIDSDFLLIVLRRLLPRRPDLKVVLMSATIDADRFSSYLSGCPILRVPGRLFPVQTMFLEDAIELTNSMNTRETQGMPDNEEYNDDDGEVTDMHSQLQNLQGYSEKTISTLRRLNEYRIDFGLIAKLIVVISTQPQFVQFTKAILIFMPGIAEMRRLHQVLTSYPQFHRGWLFHILHSTVSTEDQQAAFRLPPHGMRKIVIATNIAETGITIPDITAVIDTGKEKIMRFDERRQVSRLTESFISKASSRQRQGRAARVQEGLCLKMYTRDRFDRLMPEHSTPEMLRLSLSETILRVKLCALGPIEASLSEALDPPAPKNIRRAIEALKEEKVLTAAEDLTPMGRQLARLPLDIPLGKLVMNGLSLGCLDATTTIAALLSSKSPFNPSAKAMSALDAAKKSFARGDSDLLLLYNAYTAWRQAEINGNAGTFCQKTCLSRPTLSLIEDQKLQLLSHLVDAGMISLTPQEKSSLQTSRYKSNKRNFFTLPTQYNLFGSSDELVNAAVGLSFYPKLLRKEGKGWRNISTNQNVTLSGQSTNRSTSSPVQWLSFYQTMQTKFQGLTVSDTSAIDELSVALLVGDADYKLFSGTMTLDSNRVRFSVRSWKAIVALKELRSKIRSLVLDRPKDRDVSQQERQWVDLFYHLYA